MLPAYKILVFMARQRHFVTFFVSPSHMPLVLQLCCGDHCVGMWRQFLPPSSQKLGGTENSRPPRGCDSDPMEA